jgi:NMD protein affecting ribosome stability and mRNA decay
MMWRECRRCGAYCDPGELVSGLCEDCTEAVEKKRNKENRIAWLLDCDFTQMKLEV